MKKSNLFPSALTVLILATFSGCTDDWSTPENVSSGAIESVNQGDLARFRSETHEQALETYGNPEGFARLQTELATWSGVRMEQARLSPRTRTRESAWEVKVLGARAASANGEEILARLEIHCVRGLHPSDVFCKISRIELP